MTAVHRKVVSVQRTIEIGIPTVVIPVESEKAARPAAAALSPVFRMAVDPGFSVGRTFGRSNDPELHRSIQKDPLLVLTSPGEPGRIEIRQSE